MDLQEQAPATAPATKPPADFEQHLIGPVASVPAEVTGVGPTGQWNVQRHKRHRDAEEEFQKAESREKLTFAKDVSWYTEEKTADRPKELDKAAMAYIWFREHDVDAVEISRIVSSQDPNVSVRGYQDCRAASKWPKSWQCQVLTNYIFPQAEALCERYLNHSDPQQRVDLVNIETKARRKYIEDTWPQDLNGQLRICHRMYKCIVKYIDFEGIFDPPTGSTADQLDVCRRWRVFIYQCYLIAMNDAIVHRVRIRTEQKRGKAYAKDIRDQDARRFASWQDITRWLGPSRAPPKVEDLPVIKDLVKNVKTAGPSKKKRRQVEPEYDDDDDDILRYLASQEEA